MRPPRSCLNFKLMEWFSVSFRTPRFHFCSIIALFHVHKPWGVVPQKQRQGKTWWAVPKLDTLHCRSKHLTKNIKGEVLLECCGFFKNRMGVWYKSLGNRSVGPRAFLTESSFFFLSPLRSSRVVGLGITITILRNRMCILPVTGSAFFRVEQH